MRRASTCPPGEDQAAQLHNMFQNDPDMKLFSPSRDDDLSFSDAMMFGSYDFSRKVTNSSEPTSPSSYSASVWEPVERANPYSYSQSPAESRSALASTRDTKEHRRRSSILKKSSRPARMSEDDIMFQQTSPTRKVEIKSRKTLKDYSSS